VPDSSDNGNIKKDKTRKSRYERLLEVNIRDEDYEVPMPPIEREDEYILQLLAEAGTASSNGMGLTGISWSELLSWDQLLGYSLTAWELTTIHELSREYATEYSLASDKDRPAPYIHVTQETKQNLDQKILSILRGFKPSGKKTVKG
jgi:hypothetical protein